MITALLGTGLPTPRETASRVHTALRGGGCKRWCTWVRWVPACEEGWAQCRVSSLSLPTGSPASFLNATAPRRVCLSLFRAQSPARLFFQEEEGFHPEGAGMELAGTTHHLAALAKGCAGAGLAV